MMWCDWDLWNHQQVFELFRWVNCELVNITARPWGLPELATRVRESQDVDVDDDDDFDIFLKSYKKP